MIAPFITPQIYLKEQKDLFLRVIRKKICEGNNTVFHCLYLPWNYIGLIAMQFGCIRLRDQHSAHLAFSCTLLEVKTVEICPIPKN